MVNVPRTSQDVTDGAAVLLKEQDDGVSLWKYKGV